MEYLLLFVIGILLLFVLVLLLEVRLLRKSIREITEAFNHGLLVRNLFTG